MAASSLAVTLTLLLTISAASAAHHAPAPAADCATLVLNMADCLSYVTVGGGASTPQGQCCSGLKTVIKTDADCICETFKNSAQLGITLNITKAMGLPTACHVSAPPLSNCGLSIVPGPAPAPVVALAPSAHSPSPAVVAPTPTIGGQELTPAPGPGKSGSSVLSVSIELLVFTTFLAVLSYVSL